MWRVWPNASTGSPAVEAPLKEGVRFRAIDVYLDSGAKALAAYQIEIECDSEESRIVGVEGGETEEYSEPPHYDPAALRGGRIVLGAFTLDDNPPSGRTRVARIHLEEPASLEPAYTARVVVAAEPGGREIEVQVELIPTGGSR